VLRTLTICFFQQMNRRDLATSARLERCFAKLGHNYPEWTADLIFEIERFTSKGESISGSKTTGSAESVVFTEPARASNAHPSRAGCL
jgi:hypothetical protein